MADPVEIGYLCRRGHFIFDDEPHQDGACGSKRMAGIFVVPEKGVFGDYFAEALADAREDFGQGLGRMYPEDPTTTLEEDRTVFDSAVVAEIAKIQGK